MPGVPDMPFLTAWNLGKGNCYWAAIASLVYGDYRYWPIVKGQHYVWFRDVMANPNHPRNMLYDLLNDDGSMDMMDRLEHANEWASTSTMQVTADLYDLFLVMFIPTGPLGTPIIYTRGCRNAPHRFMQLVNGDHYEPMRPAYGRPSEFHFPETSGDTGIQNEDDASASDESESVKVPIQRSDIPDIPLPEQLLPRPQLERPTYEIIQMMIGVDSSDSVSKASGLNPQPMRDYAKMTKARMKEVLKTEYSYKGYSKLTGDAVREKLEELDRQKATEAAKLAKNVKGKNAVKSSKSGDDKKNPKDGKAGKAAKTGKVMQAGKAAKAGQAGNGKKVEKSAAPSKAKTKPNLHVKIPSDDELCFSDGASDSGKVKSPEKPGKKRKRSDDSSGSQSKKQKST